MKKFLVVLLTASLFCMSCAGTRGITNDEAANGKAKCGRHLR